MRLSFKRLVSLCLIVVFSSMYFRFSAGADEQRESGPTGSAAKVSLLDVGRFFKESVSVQGDMAKARAEAEASKREFVKRTEVLANRIIEYKNLTPGTPEHADLKQQITAEQAELKVAAEQLGKRALSQEAKVYAEHYERLQRAVADYAKQRGVQLVLRKHMHPMNPNEPSTVLDAINQVVVFEDHLDITDDLIRILDSN